MMTNNGAPAPTGSETALPETPASLAIRADDVNELRNELRQARILIEILTNANRGLAERLAWEKLVNQEDAAKPKA